jgi:hypothetical protein
MTTITRREQMATEREIETMRAVIDAARCIRHWHDASNGGMVVSGDHVRALWQALADYDEILLETNAWVKDAH